MEHRLVETGRRNFLQVIFGRTMIVISLLLIQYLILFSMLSKLAAYLPYFFGGVYTFTAIMLIYILNTDNDPTIKLSWSIVIAVLPAFGALLYLYLKLDLGHRIGKQAYQDSVDATVKYLPDQSELMRKIDTEDTSFYGIASYLKNYGHTYICENTEVRYLSSGEEKFAVMLEELEKAEKYIFLEYFIIKEGYMWNTILNVLVRKARQGVDVRVMYDGTNTFANLPATYPKYLRRLGIKCKVFAPLRPFLSTHYNNRDHRKILVIDGHTAITGGVNLADEYINYIDRFGHWKDTAVMMKGEAARNFVLMFLQLWNSRDKNADYDSFLNVPSTTSHTANGYVIPYGDSPTDNENVGEAVYLHLLNHAKDYIYITTPYLILDHDLILALRFAAKRGVDVRVVVPSRSDHWYVTPLAKTHYHELCDAGVKVYEYTPGFIHAKMFLCDDSEAVVGTINLDYRSLYWHFECATYLHKVEAIQDIKTDFYDIFDKSKLIMHQDLKNISYTDKILGALFKVIAPLM
ncbi:MAG: cardiolipin synthase [Erysipelotrichales bacterium]|nr:cardiolipin synthase [Erysipelotrichales bacterium]